jgi:chromosome partitioning protein
MEVVTFINEKGGAWKTTGAVHLAAGFAIQGARVVLIDADPQGNATVMLGLPLSGALYDLTVRGAAWKDALRKVHPDVYGLPDSAPKGELYVVPSNVETRNIATSISDGAIFTRRLSELQTFVDYVIIDTSPTPSLLHAAITAASDYILIPTQLEAFSAFYGVAASLLHCQEVQHAAAQSGWQIHAEVLGIVPVMARRTVAHATVLTELKEQYGAKVWDKINASTVVVESAIAKQLVFGYAPKSAAARELWQFIGRVEREVNREPVR